MAAAGTSAAPWRSLLQRSLATNSNLPYAKYMQLASVRQDGRPAVRTVVFRGFLLDSDLLTFVTDRRSRKVAECAANSAVEVCWYFPSSREQYRLSGVVDIIPPGHADTQLAAAREAAWAAMSDAGRAQFLWPTPGLPRLPMDESLFLVGSPDTAGAPVDSFCLGVISVTEVDHIDLYSNKRTVFTSSSSSSTGGQGAPAEAAAAADKQQPDGGGVALLDRAACRRWAEPASVNP